MNFQSGRDFLKNSVKRTSGVLSFPAFLRKDLTGPNQCLQKPILLTIHLLSLFHENPGFQKIERRKKILEFRRFSLWRNLGRGPCLLNIRSELKPFSVGGF